MNQTLLALTGFAGWTLVLSFILLNMRAYYTFLEQKSTGLQMPLDLGWNLTIQMLFHHVDVVKHLILKKKNHV